MLRSLLGSLSRSARGAKRKPVQRRVLRVEALEVRSLLSVAPSLTTLSVSAASLAYGQTETLTATVSASTGVPTGTVTFADNGSALGSPVTLNSSAVATFQVTTLPVGLDVLTASYSGDSNYAASNTTVGPNSIITTVAGNGTQGYGGDNGPATAAELNYPYGVAVDSAGDVFIADLWNAVIREVNHATGAITTVAGNGTAGFSGDNGPATAAELDRPLGVALNSAGDLFIADWGNNRIREVNYATGVITTVAGGGAGGGSDGLGDNGPATAADLRKPFGVAVDSAGDLFIADWANNRIREVNHATGLITTVAGNGTMGFSGDNGQATAAELDEPEGVALDSAGDLFIADTSNTRIREVNHATGTITTVAGIGTGAYYGDNGPATAAELNYPNGVAVDSAGDLFIADTGNSRIREVNYATGVITTVAGGGAGGGSDGLGDSGPATAAELFEPQDVTLDSAADLFIADAQGNRVRKVTSGATTVTVTAAPTSTSLQVSAASLAYGQTETLTATVTASGATPTGGTVTFFDGGASLGTATLTSGTATLQVSTLPVGIDALTASYGGAAGFLASSTTVGPSSIITTVAGNGTMSYSGDSGPASAAQLFNPSGVVFDAAGDLFIADQNNYRVREVNHATGIITTVAGDGSSLYSGNGGPATAAAIGYPTGLAIDSAGNLYIADEMNDVIRKVNLSSGVITTVAGTGTSGYSGDNGPATAAKLDWPTGVAVDSSGDVFIADQDNQRIREVLPTGTIITVAGTGSYGYSGDSGKATAAELCWPAGVAVDSSGDLYIADQNNERVRKVVLSTGVITTVAGNGSILSSGGSGAATATAIGSPTGVALDSTGDLFIVDNYHGYVFETSLSTGAIATVAGTGQPAYGGDGGPASAAALQFPYGAAVDPSGNLFIADYYNERIRKVTSGATTVAVTAAPTSTSLQVSAATLTFGQTETLTATVTASSATPSGGTVTFLDGGVSLGTATLTAGTATLQVSTLPVGINALTASYGGTTGFLASSTTVTTSSIITTVAGSAGLEPPVYGGDNGPATAAFLQSPYDVAADAAGDIFIADTSNDRIREINHATGLITTIAGNGTAGYNDDNIQATAAELDEPEGIALNSAGDLFIADYLNERIREVNLATGMITTVAGIGTTGFSGDNGPATAAKLDNPRGVAVDAAGDLFIADSDNQRIREVNYSSGVITTVAGNGTEGHTGDNGPATAAELAFPTGVAVDAAGDLFIADTDNDRIRQVNYSTGIITTVAGNGTAAYSGDNGPATTAELDYPRGIAADAAGDVFIADDYNARIREVNAATGLITTVAGNGTSGYGGANGPATAAELDNPFGVALDSAGDILIADTDDDEIRELASGGVLVTVTAAPTSTSLQVSAATLTFGQTETLTATVTASGATPSGGTVTFLDGGVSLGTATLTAGTATLPVSTLPAGIDVLTASYGGTANFAASSTTVTTSSIITTVAGNGTAGYGGDNGLATAAQLYYAADVVVDAAGNIFIADAGNNRIREVNHATGLITTVAGNGAGYSGDGGPATAAELYNPTGLALDSAGDLFIADYDNSRIREVNHATGVITTVAGNGIFGYSGDNGPATAAELGGPWGVAVDAAGDVFIADQENERIREVNHATGVITTVAGDGYENGGGEGGFAGDNGPATAAELSLPSGVTVDAAGDLFIADTDNSRIREVNAATGVITTVAGDGIPIFGGDFGPATAAGLSGPYGVALDAAGDLFIADTGDERIREVNRSTGAITTIAGDGYTGVYNVGGYSGDNGPASAAELGNPTDVALDAAGDLVIADEINNRVREVVCGVLVTVTAAPTSTSLQVSAATLTFGQTETLTATVAASGTTPSGGTVTFLDGGVSLGTATLTAGTATLPVSTLPAGIDVLTATYGGTANFAASSTTVTTSSIITTVVGDGSLAYNGDGIPATAAQLSSGTGIAVDSAGDIFIADNSDNSSPSNNRIREVNNATGLITTVAGNGTAGYSGDGGPATAAELDNPTSIAVDSAGDLFIADEYNQRIREVNHATGVITTFAGNGAAGLNGDNGPATAAELHWPLDVALDSAGDLFIADWGNDRIREVNHATGVITTVAGNGTAGYGGDNGPATAAELWNPTEVAVDSAGDLFITDSGDGRIREVNHASGTITTVAGGGDMGLGDNGPATAAELDGPTGGIALDSAGNLYIADENNQRVREVNHVTGVITTVAGNGSQGYSGDNGQATAAELYGPTAVALDSGGDLFIDDSGNGRIREVNHVTGAIATVAGTGFEGYSGDNGQATAAELYAPYAVAVDSAGDLFIADYSEARVREVNHATGVITTVAGNGTRGYGGDNGPATAAELSGPVGVAVDSAGDIFISDQGIGRVREVNHATGVISTVASGLSTPQGVATDSAGDLFIADTYNYRILEMNAATRAITTVAGDLTGGYSGDGGPATAAELYAPYDVAVDSAGDLFIADYLNQRVREVNYATGLITTVVGNGTIGGGGDGGPATAAELDGPDGVALDSAGDLFIADAGTDRVREVNHATGIIATVAGNETNGFSGDNGPATAAELYGPAGIAVDSAGNLFVADSANGRIREVSNGVSVTVTPAPTSTSLQVSAATLTFGQTETLTATVTASSATPSGGTVTFLDGGVSLGTATLTAGTATLQVSTLPVGINALTASYGGTANFAASSTVVGPNSIIATAAGNGNTTYYYGDGNLATAAGLDCPHGVVVDSAGDLFIADASNNRIREVNHATGLITTVVGNGTMGFSGDNGQATAAELDEPEGVALDSAGDLFIADYGNNKIREVNHATGVITTVAGNGTAGFGGDNGPATAAELSFPDSVAVDSAGDLFIADIVNNRIREVNAVTHVITTVVGNGTASFSGDNGPATAAELSLPDGVALDSAGDLFIADQGNGRIREVNAATHVITTVAGAGNGGFSGDNGPATAANVTSPTGVAVDAAGDLFIAQAGTSVIREVNHATGVITTVAGNAGVWQYSGDNGPATAAGLYAPNGVAVDAAGDLFIADTDNNRIREVNASTKLIATVAGGGSAGDGGQATAAELYFPQSVAMDAAGDLFIADTADNRIREVNHATGLITTVAGNGTFGLSGDNGPATAANVDSPEGVAVDAAGDLFIAETARNRICEVNHATGLITTVAGTGTMGFSGDNGPATAAALDQPEGIALDSAGDLFIADFENNRIREVNHATGLITTVAGNGTAAFGGDNGLGTAAELDQPEGVALDSAGDLFIADSENNRIREVNHATGIITTVAGNGSIGFSGENGPATAANLSQPYGVALDTAGDLFIADTFAGWICEVNSATGVIAAVAGGGFTLGDNGPATAAGLSLPYAVALDSAGDLFIADEANNRVREVVSGASVTVTAVIAPTATTLAVSSKSLVYGQSLTVTATVTSAAGTPNDGTLTFYVDGVAQPHPPTVADGIATWTTTALEAGSYTLTAVYSGDGSAYAASSTAVTTISIITTVAGNGTAGYGGDNGQATAAELNVPLGVAVDAAGDIFIADTSNNRIREINHATGLITTIAGNGTAGYNGDNIQATAAELDDPEGIAVSPAGNLFIADYLNERIRELNLATGIITTVAGIGTAGFSGDNGPATAAEVDNPRGVGVDSAGDLFIADSDNERIREVNHSTGVITTVAGKGAEGHSGDNGPATAAELAFPTGVVVDAAGDLFIADTDNERIREVNYSTGIITTVAGNGTAAYSGDNAQASAAELDDPRGIAVDAAGDVFIADADNNRIREVNAATGVITTVAGNGTSGYGGANGPATAAELNSPFGVAVDSVGDILIADKDNNRIREVASGAAMVTVLAATPTITWSNPAGITYGTALSGTQLDATANVAGSFAYTPAAGTVLGAGNNQTLSVTFTPSDAVDYTSATASVSINVVPPVVVPGFTLTSPTSGTFTAGQNVTITWTATITPGDSGSINLAYAPNATAWSPNACWMYNVATAATGTGTYAWNTTGVAAGTYYLCGYLWDATAGEPLYNELYTTPVVIQGGDSFAISTPSPLTYAAGQNVTIQWTESIFAGHSGSINLAYACNATAWSPNACWMYNVATAGNGTGTYVWNTSAVAAGTYYLSGYFWDATAGQPLYSELYNTPVVIQAGDSFAISTPSPMTYTAGQNVTIQWSESIISGHSGSINLAYAPNATAWSPNATWMYNVATAGNGTGTYAWSTASVAAGTYYLSGYFWDATAGQPLYSELYATPIVIQGGDSFAISTPGALTYTAGQSVSIQWTDSIIGGHSGSINLAYACNATAWSPNACWMYNVATAGNGTGTYAWNTASVAAGTYYLSGYFWDATAGQPLYSELYTTPVVIQAGDSFAIATPGALTYAAGQNVTIQWSESIISGHSGSINLAYAPNATAWSPNATWMYNVATAGNGTGTYAWNTTGVTAGTYYLSGYFWDATAGEPLYSELYSTPVVIQAGDSFAISTPGALTYTAGQNVTIQWTESIISGHSGSINLAYAPNATAWSPNATWMYNVATAGNGTGTYAWNTTGVTAGTYYLSGYFWDATAGEPLYNELYTTPVVIQGGDSFAISTPGALTYTAGQNVTIQWTESIVAGNSGSINLAYAPNATAWSPNATWMYNVATAGNGTGTYVWNTTGVAAGTYYLSGYFWDATAGEPLYSELYTTAIVIT